MRCDQPNRNRMRGRSRFAGGGIGRGAALLLTAVGLLSACTKQPPAAPRAAANPTNTAPQPTIDPRDVTLLDEVASQPAPSVDLLELAFTTEGEQPATLKDYGKDKNLVVVVLQGFSGTFSPYCAAQTAQLIANYKQMQALNAEVVIVYPVEKIQHGSYFNVVLNFANDINSIRSGTAAPFTILLDVGMKAVDALGIRQSLAKPATYILDQTGTVKFTYVGNSTEDRPSAKVILAQLDQISTAKP